MYYLYRFYKDTDNILDTYFYNDTAPSLSAADYAVAAVHYSCFRCYRCPCSAASAVPLLLL
jgi:hypothetical protein